MFTSFSDYLGPTYRDDAVPRDVHTLVQPYQGLVVQVIDAADDRAELGVAHRHLPARCGAGAERGGHGSAPSAAARPAGPRRELEGREAVTVLHFLDTDPRECWDDLFAGAEETIAASGVAHLGVQAASCRTHHGTDDYTDQLF